jgi:hypothetical protein
MNPAYPTRWMGMHFEMKKIDVAGLEWAALPSS